MKTSRDERPAWRMVLFAALLLLMGAGVAAMVTLTAVGNEPAGVTLWLILAGIVAALVIVIVLETAYAAEANRRPSKEH